MAHISLPPRRTMGTEDISDLQFGPGHRPLALFQPSSQGLVLQELHLLERADGAADGLCCNMGIPGSGRQLGVAKQHLDHAHVRVGFQQMRGEAVPQCVQRGGLLDTCHVFGRAECTVQLSGR